MKVFFFIVHGQRICKNCECIELCGKLIKKQEGAQIVMFVIISVKKEYIIRKYHVNRKGCLQVRKLGSQN